MLSLTYIIHIIVSNLFLDAYYPFCFGVGCRDPYSWPPVVFLRFMTQACFFTCAFGIEAILTVAPTNFHSRQYRNNSSVREGDIPPEYIDFGV